MLTLFSKNANMPVGGNESEGGMTRLKVLLLGCSLAALGGAAGAQETRAGQVGEVVVTAQRRSESVQDVPISINVFSSEKLAAAAVQNLPQLAQLTPGLQFQAIGATETPFLRGVGNTISLAGSESTVALVVDGVYISAQAAILKSLASIEAIEVDRGPQGTLFGRNATGGVIQIRTRDPGQTPKLDAMIGYGNFATWEGSFYGSTPLSDALASDIAVSARRQSDGWGTNLFNGDDVFKGYDYALRSKSVWRPSEAAKVAVILDYEKVRSQHGFATRLPLNGEFGFNQVGRNGFVFTGGFYDVNANFKSGNTTKTGGGSVDWTQDLGLATFRSISAYHHQRWVGTVDFDNTPFEGSHQTFSPDIETYSQEFQLLSPSEGRFTWVVGSYLYRDVSHYAPTFIDYPAGAVVSDTTIDGKLYTNSWAVFGQGTYKLTDATRFTAGVRYTEDRRRIRNVQSSLGPVPGPLTQTGKDTFPKVTYHFALDHRFTERVMGYVQVSRGFKSG
ncbi:MAG: TonB-dependent receptor, partial [Phenylobacterium sp.]|nr:TonB-dependent receptor [Phenylobacterium sp.]